MKFPIQTFPKGEGHSPKKRFGYMTGGNNSHLLIDNAQANRKEPTQAEEKLWQELKGKKLEYKFRRQHLIDDFIVDFVCLNSKLIIEVDGGYHMDIEQQNRDIARTVVLDRLGYKVIRFRNEEVLNDINSVIAKIKSELKSREPQPETLGAEQVLPFG